MMRPEMRRIAWLWAGAAVLAACSVKRTTPYVYPDDLTHANPVRRTKAVRKFATLRDVGAMPRAFDLLLDDEAQVRSLAYEAIKEMSGGRDFGYRSYLSVAARVGIVARWEAWWVAGKGQPEEGGEPAPAENARG